jgi:hypothetical protein
VILESPTQTVGLSCDIDNNEGWGYGLSFELGRKFAFDDALHRQQAKRS